MPLTFAHFLEQRRKERDLTQQDLLELLLEADATLSKLDLTTYSRWERGVTTPKLAKQLAIARILGEDVAPLVDPKSIATLKNQNTYNKIKNRTHYPYSAKSEAFNCCHYKELVDQVDLCQQLATFHLDYLDMAIDAEAIRTSKLLLNTYQDSSNRLVGHLLYGFVPTDTSNSLFYPDKIVSCPFTHSESIFNQLTDMYVVSSFSSISVVRMANIPTMLDTLRKNTKIKNLIINCHDQEAFNLYDANTEYAILSKGIEVPFGGVKVFGKHYKYVQVKMSVESLLASKVISSIVPNTEKFIQSLLNNHS